jgi:hypothetical protein
LGDYSSIDWSEADIVYIPSISYSEKKLMNLLQYVKNLRVGSKIITLRLPQISGISGLKGGGDTKKLNNFNNGDNVNDVNNNNDNNNDNNDINNDNIDNENYDKYFNFERTIWLKTTWGRMRAFLLVRNKVGV